MTVSMNASSIVYVEEMKSMNFLGLQINNIYKNTDKTMQITELAKEFLGSKKETFQETEVALLASKCSSSIEKQALKLFAMSLHKLSVNPLEAGFEYIRKAPGYDPIRGFQVPNDWEENGTVTLNQIYKEQFFAWMMKNHELPFSSIVSMLYILKSFNDPSIALDNHIWNKFLLTGKRQEQFKEFQAKYEFLIENKFLQSFPIELSKIPITRNAQTTIHSYYKCFKRAFEWLVELFIAGTQPSSQSTKAEQMVYIQALADGQRIKDRLESMLKRNFSKKMLAYKLRKMLPSLRKYFEWLVIRADLNQIKMEDLRARQVAIDDILMICKEKKEQISDRCAQSTIGARKKKNPHKVGFNIQIVMKDLLKKYEKWMGQRSLGSEAATQFNLELHSILREKMTSLKHIQDTEAYFILEKNKIAIQQRFPAELCSFKEMFPCISSLLSYVDTGVAEEQDRWKREKWSLSISQFDEMLERELLSECEVVDVISVEDQRPSTDFSDEPEEEIEEESVSDSLSKEISDLPHVLQEEKMRSYLDDKIEDKQLNGCLSQTVEGLLKQMQVYLHGKQGKEVYDHILLGAAALEQMAQAIYEGRTSHAVLGFRSSLIHCHFAVEQILSQKSGGTADSHNLSFLAKELEKKGDRAFSKEERELLEEIRVHLWFHYPEDYRMYFAEKKCPKALFLLNALFRSENIQEAMVFSFNKYCQTLKFVIGLTTGTSQSSTVEIFLKKFLDSSSLEPKKNPTVDSPMIRKINRVLKTLHSLDELTHIKDLDNGWLLANFDTIKKYLSIMKISLELPQEATEHSLQKFIRIEALLNVEKLFKNLFRVIGFFQSGTDTRIHNLHKFYSIIEERYEKLLSKDDKNLLDSINLNITHHYFHKKSHASLKKDYDCFLRESRALSSVDKGFSITMGGKQTASHETLQKAEEKITAVIGRSLDLFIRLLDPVVNELKEIDKDIKEGISVFDYLKIG
ncbi:MAG: hypothetical protein C5B45_04880 [Chlamydiae bacterium]|nr:MAG: hypothetical protein C5B45_04880 [Chlamydiota bacterium]